jgi:nucleotide-binding universal stress UspA family protein
MADKADAASSEKIVVGFDGSPGSQRALDWALRHAVALGMSVDVVQAWSPGEFGSDSELGDYTQAKLEKEVDAVATPAGVEWTARAVRGHASKVLEEASGGAALVVVGSRGHSTVTGLLAGSVSLHLVSHAASPAVVVVRG